MRLHTSTIILQTGEGVLRETIKRSEFDGTIVWNTRTSMVKMIEDVWYEIKDNKFVKCEEPEYEKQFKSLMNELYKG